MARERPIDDLPRICRRPRSLSAATTSKLPISSGGAATGSVPLTGYVALGVARVRVSPASGAQCRRRRGEDARASGSGAPASERGAAGRTRVTRRIASGAEGSQVALGAVDVRHARFTWCTPWRKPQTRMGVSTTGSGATPPEAEREGFEPSIELAPDTRLAGE